MAYKPIFSGRRRDLELSALVIIEYKIFMVEQADIRPPRAEA